MKITGYLGKVALSLLILLLTGLTGCGLAQFVVHKMVPAGKGEWIPAECTALTGGEKVLILVYAEESIQYMHQQLARFDTAAVVASEMQDKLKVDVVDPAAVEHYQSANVNWTEQPLSRITERYQADYIMYIELLAFSTSAEESGELVRGQVEANCVLYSSDDTTRDIWQGKVSAAYPESPVVSDLGVAERVRYETLKLFADRLVKHFYGHNEPL